MRHVLLAAAALLTASAGAAYADQPAAAKAERQVTVCNRSDDSPTSWVRECGARTEAGTLPVAAKARQVFMCDRTAATRRAWVRQYGSITFVSADELNRAEASGEGWATPRCMTPSEMRKFSRGRPEEVTVARALNAAPGF
jgi:hypothetical protein